MVFNQASSTDIIRPRIFFSQVLIQPSWETKALLLKILVKVVLKKLIAKLFSSKLFFL
ncbi:unnamed protein product [Moneuplotes crassus]|uniref:Uncharacterized protein n=1 Tax=Euplotes crassus TaxID=5936 RepID=A0AAD1UPF0_EUPCR|nr:unnamed protein product [Moneuplotes crassus]